jgi:hypothetical protein
VGDSTLTQQRLKFLTFGSPAVRISTTFSESGIYLHNCFSNFDRPSVPQHVTALCRKTDVNRHLETKADTYQ